MASQNETRNMGYCFLTFSHADEARMMLLRFKNPYLNGMRLQLDLKSSLDHSDMDFEFFAGRMRNEGRLLGEVKAIREARNELKEFEKDFDSHLPSRKKLEDFRKLARKVIEGGEHERNRNHKTDQRTPREEELLREKIAILEKKYPHVDMSQLFVTEKAEQTKRALHKNAFASYKAFEFLKHGIN
jgi:RNA recognition motif-containing protein